MPDEPQPPVETVDVAQKFVGWVIDKILIFEELTRNTAYVRSLRELLELAPGDLGPVLPQDAIVSLKTYRDDPAPDFLTFLAAVDDLARIGDALADFVQVAMGGASTPELVEEGVSTIASVFALAKLRHDVPWLYALGSAIGLVDEQLAEYGYGRFRWERLRSLLSDAASYFDGMWKEGATDVERSNAISDLVGIALGAALVTLLYRKADRSSSVLYGWEEPTTTTPVADDVSAHALSTKFELGALPGVTFAVGGTGVPRSRGGPGLFVALGGSGKFEVPVGGTWELELELRTAGGLLVRFEGPALDGDLSDAGLVVRLRPKDPKNGALPAIPGVRATFGTLAFELEISKLRQSVKVISRRCSLVLGGRPPAPSPGQAAGSPEPDGFLARSLPGDGIRVDFDLGIGFDFAKRRLFFTDGSRLQVVIPIGKEALGVRVVYLVVEITPVTDAAGSRVRIELSGAFSLTIGPVSASVDRMGLELTARSPLTASTLGFKPPTGIGVAIDAEAASGGGYLYFDREAEEYAGVVQLTIADSIELTVIALVTTRLPGGEKGFSMLFIGSVAWTPGWPLPWTLALSGLGLLVGIHRSVVLDVLRSGVKDGTVSAILFPKDAVRNAPALLATLRNVFPPTRGRHVLGLMARITQATLRKSLTIQLGVAMELPAPVKVLLLVQVRLALPRDDEKKALLLAIDAVGSWDQAEGLFAIDGTLRDSKIGRFPIAGDAAIRIASGKPFVFAVGGIRPDFDPGVPLPRLERVSLTLGSGENPRVRALGYVAMSPNTLQFGAAVELAAKAAGFGLEGFGGIEGLLDTKSGSLRLDVRFAIKVKRGSSVLLSLGLDLRIDAFRPIVLDGELSFKILFVKTTIPIHFTIGEAVSALVESVDVLGELVEALSERGQWSGRLDASASFASLREAPLDEEVVTVHPLARLEVAQQVVPLDVDIDQFGTGRPAAERRFSITRVDLAGAEGVPFALVDEEFAPANFFSLSDRQKLARPPFERLRAGVRVGGEGPAAGPAMVSDLLHETILLDRGEPEPERLPPRRVRREELAAGARLGAGAWRARSAAERFGARGARVDVSPLRYAVAGCDDLAPVAGQAAQGTTYTESHDLLRRTAAGDLRRERRLQVVGRQEVP